MSNVSQEFVKTLESNPNLSWVEKLTKLLEEVKSKDGFNGFSPFVDPTNNPSVEDVAESSFGMIKEFISGTTKDITGQVR